MRVCGRQKNSKNPAFESVDKWIKHIWTPQLISSVLKGSLSTNLEFDSVTDKLQETGLGIDINLQTWKSQKALYLNQ